MDEAQGCLFLLMVVGAVLYALMALGVSIAVVVAGALAWLLLRGVAWLARKALGAKNDDSEE